MFGNIIEFSQLLLQQPHGDPKKTEEFAQKHGGTTELSSTTGPSKWSCPCSTSWCSRCNLLSPANVEHQHGPDGQWTYFRDSSQYISVYQFLLRLYQSCTLNHVDMHSLLCGLFTFNSLPFRYNHITPQSVNLLILNSICVAIFAWVNMISVAEV